jgi:hypothetical protein
MDSRRHDGRILYIRNAFEARKPPFAENLAKRPIARDCSSAGTVYGRQLHGKPYAASFPIDKIDA